MDKRFVRKTLGVRVLSWVLAVVLAVGGWPLPALQGLVRTETARAEEVELVDEPGEESQGECIEEGVEENEDENQNAPIFFNDPVDYFLVTNDNSDVSMTLNTDGLNNGMVIDWKVGLCVVDDWVEGHVFTQGVEYDIDGSTITLHGNKVLEHMDGYGEVEDSLHVRIFIQVKDPSILEGNPVVYNDTHWIDFAMPHVNYEQNSEQDRDMLPGWDGEVRQWYTARVWNDENPYGSDEDYEVLGVVSSNPNVVSVEREGDDNDHSWRYRAHEHGTATLTVTYQEIDSNKTGSYSFGISVGTDVYDVDWTKNNVSLAENNNGSFMGLPGQSIVIDARAVNFHEDGEDTFDGFTYDWSLEGNGAELAQITGVENHEDGSCSATVTFNNNNSYQEGRWLCEDVFAHLRVSKNNKTLERSIYLHLENEYPEIWIQETGAAQIDTNMAVGATQEVTPEVRYYVQDYAGTYTLGEVTRLCWDFDTNALSITYNGGIEVQSGQSIDVQDGHVPTFTITRMGDWGTEVHLHADWEPTEDNGRFALLPADKGGTTPGWRHEHSTWFLNSFNTNVWFDGAPKEFFVTEDNPTATLPLNWNSIMNVPGFSLAYTVGLWDDDQWVHTFTEGTDYTTGDYGVRLNGEAILAQLGDDEDELNVRVVAEVKSGNDTLSDCDHWIKVLRPSTDYDREWDRDLLPGWDGDVSGHRNVRVRDEDHADGEDFRYYVTNVEILEGAELIDLRKDYDNNDPQSDEYWWHYMAKDDAMGTATLKVTYNVPDVLGGGTGSYTFNVNIVNDVYGVDVYASEGDSWGLPGETLTLGAYGWHKYLDDHGDEQCVDTNDAKSGLSLAWSLKGDADRYATLANASGTSNALALKQVDEDHFHHDLWVEAILSEDGNEVARGDNDFAVDDNYPTITPYPTDFFSNLPVGTTVEITPIQLWRSLDHGSPREENISNQTTFNLSFDSRAVRIEADGLNVDVDERNNEGRTTWTGQKTLRITRLEGWGTDINLNTEFNDDEDSRSWRLNEVDYHLRFDVENSDAWVTREDDGTFTDAADVTNGFWMSDDLASVEGMELAFTVGTGDWSDDEFEWDQTFDAKSGVWDVVDEDGRKSVVVHAAKLAELGVQNARVEARAMLGDTELAGGENDWWVHLKEREVDYGRELDRDLLPDWDGSVRPSYNVWVRNEDHPDEERIEYKVTDVEVVAAKDAEDKDVDWETLIEFHKDSNEEDEDDYWWYYRALELGTVTLKVTYEVPEELGGGTESYTFNLYICTDVYDVNVWSQNVYDYTLPGTRVELYTQGTHHRIDDEATNEGLTYVWRLREGADVGHLEVDEDDPQHATFVVNPMGPDKMGFDDLVHVRVYMFDGGDESNLDESVANRGWAFKVRNMYDELWPIYLNRQMAAGSEVQVTPELRSYLAGEDYEVLDAEFQWTEVNTSKFSITDAEGNDVANSEDRVPAGTYTIRRLNGEGTDFTLRCWYNDGQGNEQYAECRYDFDNMDYRLCFDGEHSDAWVTISDDGTYSNATDVENGLWVSDELASVEGMELDLTVGTGDWGDHGFEWEQTFDNKSGVWDVVDGDGQKSVVVHGAKLAELGVENVRVEARAMLGTTQIAGAENDWWVHLRERELNYDREESRDLLPTWDGSIDEHFNVWMRDEEHPDGENYRYHVTNVEVVGAEDAEGNQVEDWESLLELHKDSDDDGYWWYYRARDLGKVTLKVTFTRPAEAGGHTNSYNLDLNIVTDEFHFEARATHQMGGFILPGETAEVWLQGYHEHAVRDGDSWRIEESTDGLDYEWDMEATYDDITTMTVDPNDPTHVSIRSAVLDPPEPRPGSSALVSALLKYDGRGVARAGWVINFNGDFPTVLPTAIDDLDVMESTTIDPKFVRRYLNNENKPVTEELQPSGLEYFWSYDPGAVRITDAAGNEVANNNWGNNDGEVAAGSGPYTITRLSERETQLGLMLRWENDGEPEYDGLFRGEYEARYYLQHKNYRIWFDEDEYQTSEDCVAVATLDVSRFAGIEGSKWGYDISIGDTAIWNDEGFGGFEHELSPSDYTVTNKGNTLTIAVPGSVIAKANADWDCDGLVISAFAGIKESNIGFGTGTHLLLVDESTHDLVRVAAKAATLSKKGTKEHWKCNRCGKLFLDEDGTQETTLEDLAIDKLIDISEATITFPARTYNGTAQTTLPVVKMGTTTLKKDTDYTVSGTTKATKVGNYNVTVTGKGLYGGTATRTYTIAPKAQTISAKNKTVAMGKTVDLGAKVTEGTGTLSYKSSNTSIAKVSTAGIVTPVSVGKATITIKAAANGNYKATSKTVTVTVTQGTQTITATDLECVTGKTASLGATTSGDGKLTYKSGSTGIATVSTKGVITGKKAGTAKITITAAKTTNYKTATKTVTVKVGKANPMVVKATTSSLSVSYATVKSKAVTTANNLTITKAQGAVTYANTSSNATAAKFTVNKTSGKVTVPKGTAKGTYAVKVTATAAGTSAYISGSVTVTYKIVVK